jgi:hypothetical protein
MSVARAEEGIESTEGDKVVNSWRKVSAHSERAVGEDGVCEDGTGDPVECCLVGKTGLLENGSVLLPEATNLVHVDGVEAVLGLLLVSGQLLGVHGLQADGGVVTDANNQHAAALGAALVVLLIGESDVNLGDIVGRVRRGVGVGEHGLAVAGDVDGAGAAVVGSLDCQAARVVIAHVLLLVVVRGKALALHGLPDLVTADEVEGGGEDEAEEDESKNEEQDVDHAVRPVLCVGREISDRAAGHDVTGEVLGSLARLGVEDGRPASVDG